jgi:hypothetical protein
VCVCVRVLQWGCLGTFVCVSIVLQWGCLGTFVCVSIVLCWGCIVCGCCVILRLYFMWSVCCVRAALYVGTAVLGLCCVWTLLCWGCVVCWHCAVLWIYCIFTFMVGLETPINAQSNIIILRDYLLGQKILASSVHSCTYKLRPVGRFYRLLPVALLVRKTTISVFTFSLKDGFLVKIKPFLHVLLLRICVSIFTSAHRHFRRCGSLFKKTETF